MSQLTLIKSILFASLISFLVDSRAWQAEGLLGFNPIEQFTKIKKTSHMKSAYNELNLYLKNATSVDEPEVNLSEAVNMLRSLRGKPNTDKIKHLRLACFQFISLGQKEADDVCSRHTKNVIVDNDVGTGSWLRHATQETVGDYRVKKVIYAIAKEQAQVCSDHYYNVFKNDFEKLDHHQQLQVNATEILIRDLLANYLDRQPEVVRWHNIEDKTKLLSEKPWAAARFASSVKFNKLTKLQVQIFHSYLIKRTSRTEVNAEKIFFKKVERLGHVDSMKYKNLALNHISKPCEDLIENLSEGLEQANFPPVHPDLITNPEAREKYHFYKCMAIFQVCKHISQSRDIIFEGMTAYARSLFNNKN